MTRLPRQSLTIRRSDQAARFAGQPCVYRRLRETIWRPPVAFRDTVNFGGKAADRVAFAQLRARSNVTAACRRTVKVGGNEAGPEGWLFRSEPARGHLRWWITSHRRLAAARTSTATAACTIAMPSRALHVRARPCARFWVWRLRDLRDLPVRWGIRQDHLLSAWDPAGCGITAVDPDPSRIQREEVALLPIVRQAGQPAVNRTGQYAKIIARERRTRTATAQAQQVPAPSHHLVINMWTTAQDVHNSAADTRLLGRSEMSVCRPTIRTMPETPTAPTCAKCAAQAAGPGGVLCPDCLAKLTENLENFWRDFRPVAAS